MVCEQVQPALKANCLLDSGPPQLGKKGLDMSMQDGWSASNIYAQQKKNNNQHHWQRQPLQFVDWLGTQQRLHLHVTTASDHHTNISIRGSYESTISREILTVQHVS
jgi:hypothetical protein